MAFLILRHIALFLVFVLAQVLVFNRIHLFDCAVPLLYVYYVILFPANMPKWLALPLAFLLGLTIDSFSNTPGLSSFSLTLVAFIQPYLLQLYLDRESREDFPPSVKEMGWMKFSTFAFMLTFVFCVVYFSLDAFSFNNFLHWLESVAGSLTLTLLTILVFDSVRKTP